MTYDEFVSACNARALTRFNVIVAAGQVRRSVDGRESVVNYAVEVCMAKGSLIFEDKASCQISGVGDFLADCMRKWDAL